MRIRWKGSREILDNEDYVKRSVEAAVKAAHRQLNGIEHPTRGDLYAAQATLDGAVAALCLELVEAMVAYERMQFPHDSARIILSALYDNRFDPELDDEIPLCSICRMPDRMGGHPECAEEQRQREAKH